MIVKADLSGRWMEYGAIVASVAICVILLNLLVGALTDTQAKAQVNGAIPMMGIAFLPMFSMLSDAVSKVTHYTFMGNFVDFLSKRLRLNSPKLHRAGRMDCGATRLKLLLLKT